MQANLSVWETVIWRINHTRFDEPLSGLWGPDTLGAFEPIYMYILVSIRIEIFKFYLIFNHSMESINLYGPSQSTRWTSKLESCAKNRVVDIFIWWPLTSHLNSQNIISIWIQLSEYCSHMHTPCATYSTTLNGTIELFSVFFFCRFFFNNECFIIITSWAMSITLWSMRTNIVHVPFIFCYFFFSVPCGHLSTFEAQSN